MSPDHHNFFDTFGFLVFRQHFTPAEMAQISRQFDELMREARHGAPHEGVERQMVLQYVERRPALLALLEDDRVYGVLEELLGPGFVYWPSDANYYVGNTEWHPDRHVVLPGHQLVKVAFYLDPVREDSGCLRVIPGSHREPLWTSVFELFHRVQRPPVYPFGLAGDQMPSYPLVSEPGDMVVFNQRLWHASYGGSRHRRMCTLNFSTRPTEEVHFDELRRNHESVLEWMRTKNPFGPADRVYDPAFLAGGGPRRQSMLRPLKELGFR
ncbi:MAG: phytanoyl-CoA dioxygenase family protein [Candidatus Latescibacteria bacterium]|nr:phytanoyl-CoA dioxygenase family protein [Candidatus Latescibacterota bacterium]